MFHPKTIENINRFWVEHVLSEGKDTKIILDMQIIQEHFYFRIQNRAKHGIHIVNND